jgi:hypothetical protein
MRGQGDIESDLYLLPDVIFEAASDIADGLEYELKIRQPIDHGDLSKGYFYQKAYVLHRGYDRPTVMVTEGYNLRRHRPYEITELLEANQIQVEHRYYGASIPDSLDYDYLNMTQATQDYHKIRTLFDEIYSGKWVSTGISKGGATTIVYKHRYPTDIDVAVPVVAPINDEYEEDRIYKFLDTVGSDDCRQKLLAVQREILSRRDEVIPLLRYFTKGAKAKYDYLDFEQAFEFGVLEYPFSFWQWGADCDDIPSTDVVTDTLLEHFLQVSDLTFFADRAMKAYGSHYYQSAEEYGYYGYETDDLQDLLKTFEPGERPHAAFTPDKMAVTFDPSLLKELNQWLAKDAHQLIYIYGALDTWTASAVPYNDKVDAEWFVLPGRSHADARIKNFSTSDKARLVSTLERWLDMEIEQE